MSGSQDDDNEAQALRLGGQRYLNKPFEIDTLLDAISGL
jgi:DNA-binding response OmpR family regulator